MTRHDEPRGPSHLDRDASGGDFAQAGFDFQDGVLLSRVPQWLACEGFASVIRESLEDIEAKFFAPGIGYRIHQIQAKNHPLSPAEFWDVIDRFQHLAARLGNSILSFAVACTGLSSQLAPVVNALNRIRDPRAFYGDDSPVIRNNKEALVDLLRSRGRPEADAQFLIDKVRVYSHFGAAATDPEALFRQGISDFLPRFADVPQSRITDLYAAARSLLTGRRNTPIRRIEIENALHGCLSSVDLPPPGPVRISTAAPPGEGDATDLQLDWEPFFGGPSRRYPPPDRWQDGVVRQLQEIREFVVEHRTERRILVDGPLRLSAAVAVGSVFSAVSGFAVDVQHRDEVWRSDAHPEEHTPDYPLTRRGIDGDGQHLVVSIGILRDPVPDVISALDALAIDGSPALHLHGNAPIVSARQANLLVRIIKEATNERLNQTQASRVHLFYAGPVPLALFLGHRLNATAPIQCYEWTGKGHYTPTCLLNP